MPRMRKKTDLPTKTCPVCGFDFVWRKKWEKVWDAVIYCSERCRRNSRSNQSPDSTPKR
ncbi:DUF2256 domain-containing protein [Alphaproteobacteria bacterium]|nr:DUF2256 domain-containing protein [Alphaproteobacteria bacterium]MDG2465940.1 DUF2256 domain-containing protein [Alphaproteobacteria bacterium]